MGGLRRHKCVVCFVQMCTPEGMVETITLNSATGKEWQFLYASLCIWGRKGNRVFNILRNVTKEEMYKKKKKGKRVGNSLGIKKCFNCWSSTENGIQINSTLSNWELDGLILQKTQKLRRAVLGKIQHCYPIISEIMWDMRFPLDKRKHAA